jgi:formylglycine-generating enzyme required for sulfatase activity
VLARNPAQSRVPLPGARHVGNPKPPGSSRSQSRERWIEWQAKRDRSTSGRSEWASSISTASSAAIPASGSRTCAARGGRDGEDDWSSAFDADGKPIANTWQGVFPVYNTNEDGYAQTAPVGCFKPNGYGLYDMIGNVWEWTSDWYRPGHPREKAVNPRGPELQDIPFARGQSPSRVIKGGSYLCASNYCARYRPAARQPQEIDLGAAHIGFRTVLNRSGRTTPWSSALYGRCRS